jgi:hypothetical protein
VLRRRHPTGSKGRGRYVAATTLAQLGSCETRQVLDRRFGERTTPELERLRDGGQRQHADFHARVSVAHNEPRERSRRPTTTDSRCFIASAVYGKCDPRTDELRRFRDTVLASTRIGRAGIALYYRVSPPIAWWLARDPASARIARAALDVLRTITTRTVDHAHHRFH